MAPKWTSRTMETWFRSARRFFCRPCGTGVFFSACPRLTPWAAFCRRFAAWLWVGFTRRLGAALPRWCRRSARLILSLRSRLRQRQSQDQLQDLRQRQRTGVSAPHWLLWCLRKAGSSTSPSPSLHSGDGCGRNDRVVSGANPTWNCGIVMGDSYFVDWVWRV
jgi:hypothetical protein